MDILQTFELYAAHMRGLRNYSRQTIDNRRIVVRLFVSEARCRQLAEVSPEIAQTFLLRGRAERGWSVSTYLTYLKHLNVFFGWCAAHGHAPANPFTGIEKPRLEKKLPRRLTCAEAERLLQACRSMRHRDVFQRLRCEAVIATMLYTGLRRAEILDLRTAHMDLQAGLLRVVQGKGGKDRNLPLNPRLIPILEAYLRERNARQPDNPFFFVSVEHGKAFSQRGIRRLFERLRAETGLDFSPHALRHTFATLMLEGGCDIYALSRLMGHSKITTTTIYLAASLGLLAKSMAKHPLGV